MPRRADPSLKVTLTCEAVSCGRSFQVYRSKLARVEAGGQRIRFCGRDCHNAHRAVRCTTCGGPNTRGGRARLCSACLAASPAARTTQRARARLAACPAGRRWCTVCDRYLKPGLFSSPKYNICTRCQVKRNRAGHLRRMGLTEEQYSRVLAAQGGRCAICRVKAGRKLFHADHDHKTGVFRGLLCSWCNHRLLGGARDSIDLLRQALGYMESPPAPAVVGVVVLGRRRAAEERRAA